MLMTTSHPRASQNTHETVLIAADTRVEGRGMISYPNGQSRPKDYNAPGHST